MQSSQEINKKEKFCFIGLSIGSAGSVESGVAVLDRNLNLIKTDKVYNLSEIKLLISNMASAENTILCVDLPKNIMMLTGKWRIESKQTQVFKMKNIEDNNKKALWKKRFSDRGSELCHHFRDTGMEVYRFNSAFSKTMLKLNPPYKSKSPAACKFLQNIIEEKLNIINIPSNLLPLPSLHAIIGAYTAWKVFDSEESVGYKQIGIHKDIPVISAVIT